MSQVPLTELRDQLSDFLDEVVTTGDEVVITRHGKPVAVLLSIEEYESLVESLNILSDDETVEAIAEARGDLAEGRTVSLREGQPSEL